MGDSLFPVLDDYRGSRLKRFVPWSLVAPHEAQAMRNHGGQDLKRLAERGGLAPSELVAVIEDRPFEIMPEVEAERRLLALWRAHEPYPDPDVPEEPDDIDRLLESTDAVCDAYTSGVRSPALLAEAWVCLRRLADVVRKSR